jgi:hypothetical protein
VRTPLAARMVASHASSSAYSASVEAKPGMWACTMSGLSAWQESRSTPSLCGEGSARVNFWVEKGLKMRWELGSWGQARAASELARSCVGLSAWHESRSTPSLCGRKAGGGEIWGEVGVRWDEGLWGQARAA